MDLNALTNSLKSGMAIANPIASLTGSLGTAVNSLTSSPVPAIASFATSLQSTISSATSAVTSITGSIMTKLPMMKAADGLQNKLNATQGVLPTPGVGGASFNNAFAPLTDAQTHLGNIQTTLSPSVLASLQAGDTTHLTSCTDAVSTASTGISTSASNSTAGIADSISTLKSYSFAKFTSMPQPAHVQNVVNGILPSKVNYESALADSRATQVTSPPDPPPRMPAPVLPNKVDSVPTVSTVTSNPHDYPNACRANCAAIGYTGIDGPLNFRNDYTSYVNGLSDAVVTQGNTLTAQIQVCATWRDANIPNYATLKAAALANPSDTAAVAAYNNAKNSIPGYSDVVTATASYTTARNNILRLRDQLNTWILAAYVGATPGPTW